MTWNYRLVRRKMKTTPGAESEYSIAIHEVYYDESGKPDMVTVDAVGVYGETVEEAREAYVMMAEAFRKVVLNYEDIAEIEPAERRPDRLVKREPGYYWIRHEWNKWSIARFSFDGDGRDRWTDDSGHALIPPDDAVYIEPPKDDGAGK